jgi:hypothetical protein
MVVVTDKAISIQELVLVVLVVLVVVVDLT